MNEFEKLMKSL